MVYRTVAWRRVRVTSGGRNLTLSEMRVVNYATKWLRKLRWRCSDTAMQIAHVRPVSLERWTYFGGWRRLSSSSMGRSSSKKSYTSLNWR